MFLLFCFKEGILFYAYYILQNCSATKGNHFSSKGPLPDSIDWRKKGNYVTDVKNQVDFACIYSSIKNISFGITDNSKCNSRLCYNQMDPKLKNNTLWHVNLFSVWTTILIHFINPISYFTFFAPKAACGSCWTFSTTGCLESVTAINTGKLVPLVTFFHFSIKTSALV